jgi:murein L,D-transpeptidase YcbB/YkuD
MMKKVLISILLTHVFFFLALPGLGRGEPAESPDSRLLRYWLESRDIPDSSECADTQNNPMESIARFYEYRNYRLAWVDRYGLLPEGEIAIQALGDAATEGLQPLDYQVPGFFRREDRWASFSVTDAPSSIERTVQSDVMITGMVMRFAFHMAHGRINPMVLQEYWRIEAGSTNDIVLQLAGMLDDGRVSEFFRRLSPPQRSYQALKQSLQRYEGIRAAGGWQSVDDGPTLKPGDRNPRVPALRDRLTATGDLAALDSQDPWLFDAPFEVAVKRFQQRHGLTVDGTVGAKTLAVLNIPVEQRIQTLKLNMERLRWISEAFGSRYIAVNIPAFRLDLVEDGHVVESMRVIVGRQRRHTPVLSGTMTYLELNPYWNIPQKIARKDILPKIQDDPLYLVRQGIHVFDSWREDASPLNPLDIDWMQFSGGYFPYRLRQEPNAHNALGRIKFMFPNELSIYIHDTPSKSLFAKQTRNFSSGCVRIEEPLTLAEALLKSQGWDREQIEAMIETSQRKVVVLKTPIPVHLVYFTAWVDGDGALNFREDIYDRDQRLAAALSDRSADSQLCGFSMARDNYVVVSETPPGSAEEAKVAPKISANAI